MFAVHLSILDSTSLESEIKRLIPPNSNGVTAILLKNEVFVREETRIGIIEEIAPLFEDMILYQDFDMIHLYHHKPIVPKCLRCETNKDVAIMRLFRADFTESHNFFPGDEICEIPGKWRFYCTHCKREVEN